jgi:hypothetical protein
MPPLLSLSYTYPQSIQIYSCMFIFLYNAQKTYIYIHKRRYAYMYDKCVYANIKIEIMNICMYRDTMYHMDVYGIIYKLLIQIT